MKKIIVFADTEELSLHYDDLLEQGAKPMAAHIIGQGGELRRAEVKTTDGHELELVFINIHIGDLLLWNREAGLVDISRVLKELESVKEKLLSRVHTIQSEYKEKLEA